MATILRQSLNPYVRALSNEDDSAKALAQLLPSLLPKLTTRGHHSPAAIFYICAKRDYQGLQCGLRNDLYSGADFSEYLSVRRLLAVELQLVQQVRLVTAGLHLRHLGRHNFVNGFFGKA
jgi:hypothetical protein